MLDIWIILHLTVSGKEKAGEMRRLERDVTLDIAVNVSPCLSMFPISIVTFCRVITWDL